VAIAIAIPATAHTFGFSVHGTTAACLAIGDASYRIAGPGEHADYTVRIDPAAATPDIRVQLTGTIDHADFVFIEGSGETRCQGGKSVKVDAAAPADLTIGFAVAGGGRRTLRRGASAGAPARAHERLELSGSR
jgi:hypothetical protein